MDAVPRALMSRVMKTQTYLPLTGVRGSCKLCLDRLGSEREHVISALDE